MKTTLFLAFSLISALSFSQTNTATPDPINNGVPIQHTTYPPQPSTVTTNPVDRGDVNNNIRPDTTFLKGQSPDITPRQNQTGNRPPNKSKKKKK
ncbi:MAG: hypothetical protein V4677_15900 [Bacteroidota bacterium]